MLQNAAPDLVVREIEQMTAVLQRQAGRLEPTAKHQRSMRQLP
jgi:hypothetical protein